jgi:HK97 gp10 family phage protein
VSVELDVECDDIGELGTKMQQLGNSLKSTVQAKLTELAYSIENTAKQLAPVRTGYLRSTISTQINDWTAKVGTAAPYAAFLEFGTRRIHAFSFLTRAFESHLPRLSEAMADAVDSAVEEAAK